MTTKHPETTEASAAANPDPPSVPKQASKVGVDSEPLPTPATPPTPPAGPELPGDVNAEPSTVQTPAPTDTMESPWAAVLGGLTWAVIIGGILFSRDGNRDFLERHRWWAVGIGAAILAVALAYGFVAKVKKSNTQTRAGLVVGLGLPTVLLVFLLVTALPQERQLLAVRSVFLLLVIFIPAIMWWLFILAQRESLLNEFLANLDRLGLLEQNATRSVPESRESRRTRVSSYLQKFEANFVKLPDTVHQSVPDGKVRPFSRDDVSIGAPLAATAVPVYLTIVVLAVGWLLTLPPSEMGNLTSEPRWLDALVPNPTPVTMAFLGAYFFSLQMLFRRYVRRDLRGSAYVAVSLRVILAVIGTWVVVEVAEGAGLGQHTWELLTVGFVIGVFPKVAWQIVQSVFAKISRRALPSMEARLPLSELDGLTVWHEARLEEEDIENVPNMATADIVDLLVSTRFPADRLIDWIDQAILLTYLGPDEARSQRRRGRRGPAETASLTARDRLAAHGVRNASSLLHAASCADSRTARNKFDHVVVDHAGNPAVPSLIAAVQTNCNLTPILKWRGLEASAC